MAPPQIATAMELAPEKCKIVVGGREIGIFNIVGKLHALRNICPHKGGRCALAGSVRRSFFPAFTRLITSRTNKF